MTRSAVEQGPTARRAGLGLVLLRVLETASLPVVALVSTLLGGRKPNTKPRPPTRCARACRVQFFQIAHACVCASTSARPERACCRRGCVATLLRVPGDTHYSTAPDAVERAVKARACDRDAPLLTRLTASPCCRWF